MLNLQSSRIRTGICLQSMKGCVSTRDIFTQRRPIVYLIRHQDNLRHQHLIFHHQMKQLYVGKKVWTKHQKTWVLGLTLPVTITAILVIPGWPQSAYLQESARLGGWTTSVFVELVLKSTDPFLQTRLPQYLSHQTDNKEATLAEEDWEVESGSVHSISRTPRKVL